jgi:hypothetical protein
MKTPNRHYPRYLCYGPGVPQRRLLTLAEALEEWLNFHSAGRGLSANTVRAYRRDIAAVAEQLSGQVPPGKTAPDTCR